MKAKLLQVLTLLCLINIGCGKPKKDDSYSLTVENNSQKSIGIYLALGGNYGTMYPDTLPPDNPKYIIYKIDPGKAYYSRTDLGWRKVFASLPKDTLSIFIFDADTLAKYPLSEIRQHYKILKRYDLSFSDLNTLNYWTIPYPATSVMKNMKMFPKYQ